MENCRVLITESAFQDLDRITDFLMGKSPSAAQRIYADLMEAYRKLEQFSLMGVVMQETPLRNEHYRKLVVGNYVTIYRFFADVCVIDHIFHAKENYGAYFGASPK